MQSASRRTGLSVMEIRRLLADDSYDPKLPTTHAEFKQFVVENVERTWDIHSAMESRELSPRDIPVIVYNGKTYSLRTSTGALDHQLPEEEENQHETCLRQIRHWHGDSKSLYSSSKTEKPDSKREKPDSFLPLGFLIEPDDEDEAGRLTNYVWALNITTNPWSLWLIYDYLAEDDLGFHCTVDLGEIYNNHRNAGKDYRYKCASLSFLGLKDSWDMLKVLNNFSDWKPEDPCLISDSQPLQQECLGSSLRAFTLVDPHQS